MDSVRHKNIICIHSFIHYWTVTYRVVLDFSFRKSEIWPFCRFAGQIWRMPVQCSCSMFS